MTVEHFSNRVGAPVGITPLDREGICQEYQSGTPISVIANKWKLSNKGVVYHLKKNGVFVATHNHENVYRGGSKRKLSDEEELQVIEEYLQTDGAQLVGSRFGLSKPCVLRILKRHGVQARQKQITPNEEKAHRVIIEQYQNGATIASIAEEVGWTRNGVYGVLIRNNIPIRDIKLSEEQRVEVTRRFQNGESASRLAEEFGITPGTVRGYAVVRDMLPIREEGFRRKYKLNESVFSLPLTPEAEYWIGYLITDGCVMEEMGVPYTVMLGQSGESGSHLNQLQAFFETDAPVKEVVGVRQATFTHFDAPYTSTCQPVYSLTIYSKKVAGNLVNYGVSPRKTHSAQFQNGLEQSIHAWRGAIDGDGWITTPFKNNIAVGLCGSLQLCQQFCDFTNRQCGYSRAEPQKHGSIFRHIVSGSRARKLIALLWDNNHVALPSKKQRALELAAEWDKQRGKFDPTNPQQRKPRKLKCDITKQELIDLYHQCNQSWKAVANFLELGPKTVRRYRELYSISTNPESNKTTTQMDLFSNLTD